MSGLCCPGSVRRKTTKAKDQRTNWMHWARRSWTGSLTPETGEENGFVFLSQFKDRGKAYWLCCLMNNRLTPLNSHDLRYQEIHSGYTTPDRNSLPDVEDDDSDPHYARIGKFRQPPSPLSPSRTPSPALPSGGLNLPQAPPSDIEGLYAKVNKFRQPPSLQNLPQAERWAWITSQLCAVFFFLSEVT